MGKKKGKNQEDLKNPETLKDLGNKAFTLRHFDEAIKHYTSAIELSSNAPNHIYFANRANGYLETNKYQLCIEDCDKALQIEPNFLKSFYRKAKALMFEDRL